MRRTSPYLMLVVAAPPIVIDAPSRVADARANAFTRSTPQGRWAALPIEIVPAQSSSSVPDVAAVLAALPAELDVVARAWRAVSCAGISVRIAPARAVDAGDDGVLAVVWQTVRWPSELLSGAPAQTVLRVDGAGFFRDADVHLNAIDFTWSLDGAAGTVDLRGVLTHELGHVLGLGHATDAAATMFASTDDPVRWRSLEGDDHDGACFLYPRAPQSTPACSVADPCPAPFVCVAARCERPGDGRATCAPCEPSGAATCASEGESARCGSTASARGRAFRCGRPCSSGEECGLGFRCERTSEAGDLQCVGDCSSGPFACFGDAECRAPATCRDGSCAMFEATPPSDGGASRDARAAPPSPSAEPLTAAGGCSHARTQPNRQGSEPLVALTLSCLAGLASVMRTLRLRRWRSAPWPPPASCRALRAAANSARAPRGVSP